MIRWQILHSLVMLVCLLMTLSGCNPAPTTAVVQEPSATLHPTSLPSDTPIPATARPSPVATATLTLEPISATNTPLSTNTSTSLPCYAARFLEDISIPDGTILPPGAGFTKTWRLENAGSCDWTKEFQMVFSQGDPLGAPATVNFPDVIARPGHRISLSVTMNAPTNEGGYRSYWMLRAPNGEEFGIGQKNKPIYADIKVQAVDFSVPFYFAENLCFAEWSTNSGSLSCPGQAGDTRGFMQRVDKPKLETGFDDDVPALLMAPEQVAKGFIRASFPALKISERQIFSTNIGCANSRPKCAVKIQIDYETSDGETGSLGTWEEKADLHIQTVSIKLDALAGKQVKFILTVQAAAPSADNIALFRWPSVTNLK